MFFLLPLLPILTTATATIGTAEIAAGTATAIGIGMTAKGLFDRKRAATIRTEAEAEYQTALNAERISVKRVKRKLIEFGKMKLSLYDSVLQKAINIVSLYKDDVSADSLQDEIALFRKYYVRSRKRCTMRKHQMQIENSVSYEERQRQFYLYMGAFGLRNIEHSPASSLYDIVLHFIVSGMEELHSAERFAYAAETESAEIYKRTVLCKKILQRLDEGILVIRHLSQKLITLCNKFDMKKESVNVISLQEKTALITDIVAVGNTLLRIIAVDICSVERKLLKEAGLIYAKTDKEFQYV